MIVFKPFNLVRNWVAAALGAAASLGAAGLAAHSQAKTNAMNKKMADEAYERQRQDIARMNELNSPSSQVSRLMAAGLSPQLAYGADGQLTGQQTDIPSYEPIPAAAPLSSSLAQDALSGLRYGLEAREQQNRDNKAVAEIACQNAQSFAYFAQGNLSTAQRDEVLTLLGFKAEQIQSVTDLNYSNIVRNEVLNELTSEQMRKIESEIHLNNEQIRVLASQYDLNVAQAYRIFEMLPHEVMNMDANTRYLWVQSEVGKRLIQKMGVEMTVLNFGMRLDKDKYKLSKDEFNLSKNEFEFEKDKFKKELGLGYFDKGSRLITSIVGMIIGASFFGGSMPKIGF